MGAEILMTTYSCFYIFAGALAVLAVASAAESSTEDSFAEATSFVQAFLSEHATGGGDSACRKVADDSIKTIETECAALQKTVDTAAAANQKCCNSGKDAVCAAKKTKKSLDGKTTTCKGEADTIANAKITFTSSLNALKGGKCKSIHGSSTYKTKKAEHTTKTKECTKLSGAADEAKKALAAAIKAAAASRKKCNSNAKKALDTAFNTAKKACNSDKNQRAFTRAQHMKCVLDGKSLKGCKGGTAPSVKKTALSKLTCKALKEIVGEFLQVMGNGYATNYKIKTAQTGGKLIPHPGKIIHMAYRIGNKAANYFKPSDKTWLKNAFSDTSKYKLTKISSMSELTGDMTLFWDVMNHKEYTAAEVTMGKKFLDKGGRLVLTGENNGWVPTENQMLSRYVEKMGGGITVGSKSLSHRAVKIAKFALTGGVKTGTYSTGYWAPLHVKASVTDVIMTNGQGQIFCADQLLRKGRLTVWADLNNMQGSTGAGQGNTDFHRNIAHQSHDFVQTVKQGGDPNKGDTTDSLKEAGKHKKQITKTEDDEMQC